MSIVTMIGVEDDNDTVPELDQAIRECQFVPISSVADHDPLGEAAQSYAMSVSAQMSWWVAVNNGSIDLDRIYDISAQIHGRSFDALSSLVSKQADVRKVAFLFFDLGNDELACEKLASASSLFEWVRDRMEAGGPLGSIFAWATK